MLRKTTKYVSVALLALSSTVFSATHELMPNSNAIFRLEPNAPEIFTNIFMMTITASCSVTLESPKALETPADEPSSPEDSEAKTTLHVRGLTRSVEIDQRVINVGDTMDLSLENGSSFTIKAKSGARVELINMGDYTIVANCRNS